MRTMQEQESETDPKKKEKQVPSGLISQNASLTLLEDSLRLDWSRHHFDTTRRDQICIELHKMRQIIQDHRLVSLDRRERIAFEVHCLKFLQTGEHIYTIDICDLVVVKLWSTNRRERRKGDQEWRSGRDRWKQTIETRMRNAPRIPRDPRDAPNSPTWRFGSRPCPTSSIL